MIGYWILTNYAVVL